MDFIAECTKWEISFPYVLIPKKNDYEGGRGAVDIKLLKTFVTVANHSSFTGAAKELYIAQSAVSKHITQLEKELGVQLFLRDTRMVRLTAAGEAFYRDSVDILGRMDTAVLRLTDPDRAVSGRLNVGAFSVMADEAVEQVRAFRARHPGVETILEWFEFGALIRQVEEGLVDAAFTIGFAVEGKAQMRRKTLEKGRMSVLLGERSPLAGRGELRLADLRGRPYYTMRPNVTPDGYMNIMRFFSEKNFQPGNMIPCSSHESMILELQVHDEGYGLMGEYLYRRHPGIVFVPLAQEDQPEGGGFDLVAMWRANNENPCLQLFLEELAQAGYPIQE